MPTWIYIGHSDTQINQFSPPATAATNPTTLSEAQVLVGRSYDASVMQGVSVTGPATNSGGANFGRGVDPLSYSIADLPGTPEDESHSATSVYTSHVVVDLTIGVGRYDASDEWEESSVSLRGVIIQMANGDMFLRPYFNNVSQWNSTLTNWGIMNARVDSVAPFNPPSTASNPDSTDSYTGGLNATASFSPTFIGRPLAPENPPCFVAGTLIHTDRGLVPVESICRGDLVLTVDHGMLPVRWTGAHTMNLRKMPPETAAALAPIRIAAGALGEGLPQRDLFLSPQHRILVRSAIARRMFGTDEVLVAVKQLLTIRGIEQMRDTAELTYLHLMFDSHQIVLAEGAAVESLYAGPEALKGVGKGAVDELLTIFPELADLAQRPASARPLVGGNKGRQLAARHAHNRKSLVGDAQPSASPPLRPGI